MGPWETPDRVIPARLFFALWRQIPALEAGTQLTLATGARLGQLLAEDPKHRAVRSAVRRLERQALPVVWPRIPDAE